MKLVSADATALGRFNPAIVEPSWYVRQGVLGDPLTWSVGVRLDGPGWAYTAGPLRWTVDQTRMVVEIADKDDLKPADRAGAFLAETLRLLSHTPLTAVGHNFRFLVASDCGGWIRRWANAASAPEPEVGRLLQAQATWDDLREGARVSASLDVSTSAHWTIRINVHRVTGTASEGELAARCAADDFAWAESFLQRLEAADDTD